MVINKHGSFYMRNGWGTKIIKAVKDNDRIFAPRNEQEAIDNIGLGRVMIKALRYWSNAIKLTHEEKTREGIRLIPEPIFEIIEENDLYFQKEGSLLLMHRNLALNKEDATAFYWLFNEYKSNSFTKESFTEQFHAYLSVNQVKVKKDTVDKEFLCLKNSYIGSRKLDKDRAVDEDTYPFLAPLKIIEEKERGIYEKRMHLKTEIPVEILIYAIANDNKYESLNALQINIDKLMEEKEQVGKYFCMKYSTMLELLMDAENKGYINLNNNFGNRFVEFNNYDYDSLLNKYYLYEER